MPITLGGKTIQLENLNNLDEFFKNLNSAMGLERVGSKGDSSPELHRISSIHPNMSYTVLWYVLFLLSLFSLVCQSLRT